jgi:hypothetical protein
MQIIDHLVVVTRPIGGAEREATFIRESTAASARRDGARVSLGDGIRRVVYGNVTSSTLWVGQDGQEVTFEPILLNVGEDSSELAGDLLAAGWRHA